MKEAIEELIKKWKGDLYVSENNYKSAISINNNELALGYDVDVERLKLCISDLTNLLKQNQ